VGTGASGGRSRDRGVGDGSETRGRGRRGVKGGGREIVVGGEVGLWGGGRESRGMGRVYESETRAGRGGWGWRGFVGQTGRRGRLGVGWRGWGGKGEGSKDSRAAGVRRERRSNGEEEKGTGKGGGLSRGGVELGSGIHGNSLRIPMRRREMGKAPKK